MMKIALVCFAGCLAMIVFMNVVNPSDAGELVAGVAVGLFLVFAAGTLVSISIGFFEWLKNDKDFWSM